MKSAEMIEDDETDEKRRGAHGVKRGRRCAYGTSPLPSAAFLVWRIGFFIILGWINGAHNIYQRWKASTFVTAFG